MSTLLSGIVYAQPAPAANPTSVPEQRIVLTNNEVVSGPITDNIRKKGEVVVQAGVKKTKYKASDIIRVELGATTYVSINYTFYEVLFAGKNITLLRKANQPSTVQYNGSEAMVISSEGNIDDLFIKKTSGALQLLTAKNISEILGQACPGIINAGNFNIETVKATIANCDSVK